MLLDFPANDVTLSLFCGQQLLALQNNTPPIQTATAIAALTNANVALYSLPGDIAGPTVWLFWSGRYGLVFINCTENIVQASGLVAGYSAGIPPVGRRVVNGYFEGKAEQITTWVQSLNIPATVDSWIVCGHSQGGALAPIVAAWFRFLSSRVRVISFGAPRSRGQHGQVYFTYLDICRWMNTDDAVPRLPPVTIMGEVGQGMGNVDILTRWSWFDHTDGGRIISADGLSITDGVVVDNNILIATINLASWLLAQTQGRVTAHSLISYVNRIAPYVSNHPRLSEQRPAGSPAERPHPLSRREATPIVRQQVQNIFTVAAEQQAPPLVVPEALPFTAHRVGRVWYVAFGGQDVAIGPTKKRALKMKNFGNQFLRRLQRAGLVNPDGLLSQLQMYLLAASTPGSGFSPTMRIALP